MPVGALPGLSDVIVSDTPYRYFKFSLSEKNVPVFVSVEVMVSFVIQVVNRHGLGQRG